MSKVATKEVATIENQPLAPINEGSAIVAMIERAARDPSVDIDKMERLMRMHEATVARVAKSSYAAALSAMQPKLPVIAKRGQIKIGTGKPQTYALWEDINEGIKPVLAEHGFALSFRTGRTDNQISVTGILSHRDGHSEETTMYLPIDASGSKNAVQAVGSSTSYGKRYTAAALLNLTSRGEDDDAKVSDGTPITDDQAEGLKSLIVEVGANIQLFYKYLTKTCGYQISQVEDILAKDYDRATKALEAKRNR